MELRSEGMTVLIDKLKLVEAERFISLIVQQPLITQSGNEIYSMICP
jgi:hypothetical protein